MGNEIIIKGARVHNLKNISLELPKNKIIVITGLSGSGKSSLAFDTIYAEGQYRYSESLSSYARRFLNLLDKPDIDRIEGLLPTIAINSRSVSRNPRSTLGTATEIYDYLRLLFSLIGKMHCPYCGRELFYQNPNQIQETIFKKFFGREIFFLAPLPTSEGGNFKIILKELKKADYLKVRFDKNVYLIEELENRSIDKSKKHHLEAVVDKIFVDKKTSRELKISLKKTLELGNGFAVINPIDSDKDFLFNQNYYCDKCNFQFSKLEPINFSFNNPYGACPRCSGLGDVARIDKNLLIPNSRLSILEGAIKPWFKIYIQQTKVLQIMENLAKAYNFSLETPIERLEKEQLNAILYGAKSEKFEFEGIIKDLEKKYKETDSDFLRKEIGKYMRTSICPTCQGKRLKNEILAVKIDDKNIAELSLLSLDKLNQFAIQLEKKLKSKELKIVQPCLKEIKNKLGSLIEIGLGYLNLNRGVDGLAGGEIQRMKLASQIGSSLSGLIFALDEPTIGLHQKDTEKLIDILKKLKNLGNTIIITEHDFQIISEADKIIDLGPGAGEEGGEIIAEGSIQDIKRSKRSKTGAYLSGRLKILSPEKFRQGSGKKIKICGASHFNLKNIDVEIPLGKLVCLTGVSGSGKSTLMIEILAKTLKQKFFRSKDEPGKHKKILGMENIDKVIDIDQCPIGRTPRSNPATYTNIFTLIRDFFSQLPEAKIKGMNAGYFSFNAEGKCLSCGGEGFIEVKMQFLPSVFVQCENCSGKRYNRDVLEIHYQDKNIADVLDMSVKEAIKFFKDIPNIFDKLNVLNEVGLSYLKLGQPATSLSGGEAQRIKLAAELSRKNTGNTLYLLDEPTTGLHFEDIKKLLIVLNKLVDKGNTVLIIEHNLEVIKCADWIIDLGPEAGEKGGYLVGMGTPKDLVKNKGSYTGQYLSSKD